MSNAASVSAKRDADGPSVTLVQSFAYAAPIAGSNFFYIPMWSILPGIYAKHFGLSLTSIAAAVVFIRLFDGVIDTTIGYLSDWHRSTGGSRKLWVIVGGLGSIVACHFLFSPPRPVTLAYYLTWSFVYFLAFTLTDIPHAAWGNELTLDYQRRATVFGVRSILSNIGIVAFYAMPLLPIYASTDYTPQVLKDAVSVGAIMTALGLTWALMAAPAGLSIRTAHEDSFRLLLQSLIRNKPLLLYFVAYGCVGLCAGMWFGLVFFYLDGYLALGAKVPLMFVLATVLAALSTPMWLKVIRYTSKSTAWAAGLVLFALQLIGMGFVNPGSAWWIPFAFVVAAHLFFSSHDVASYSILGDIVDYGKLKFHQDRGATYFGFNTLIFKVGLGLGGGLAIGIAGLFEFDPAQTVHSAASIVGLKLGMVILPASLAFIALLFILHLPIDRRRHRIIQRRLESRLATPTSI